ncbi:hypothetical protein [Streptomyces sp. NPDC059828]|uniref:hypothetical protein n=1 Tax=Streptomyces sp. NPDC059828 TaxID=3346965 RepID=UPI003649DBA9
MAGLDIRVVVGAGGEAVGLAARRLYWGRERIRWTVRVAQVLAVNRTLTGDRDTGRVPPWNRSPHQRRFRVLRWCNA